MLRRLRLRPDRYYLLEMFGFGLTSEQLQRICDEFGPLSEIGRKRLSLGVIKAVQSSWYRGLGKGTPASKLVNHFRIIDDKANELLRLLAVPSAGYPDDTSQSSALPLGIQIARVLIEEYTSNPVLKEILAVVPAEGVVVGGVPREAGQPAIRVTHGGSLNLVRMGITMLAEAASRARAEASAAVSPGRGGPRRKGRTPSSLLALDLISVYIEMRSHYPNSGPASGYSPGGPLSRFVLAVFAALAEHGSDLRPVSDASIGELFYEFRKPKAPRE